jgi:ABC-type nitrate/sulfonate/bicarbonate transport system substrate-binding protein
MKHPSFRRSLSYCYGAMLLVGSLLSDEAPAQIPTIKPEKNQLEVAIAAWGATSLPTAVALDGGYFAKHGLAVNISVVAASTSVQALISGRVDIYQGGATAIAGNLGGADIIYVGASVDRSSLMLLGQKNITSFEQFRGKTISTTSPGAFGEIVVRMTARKHGMEVGKDVKLIYHRTPGEALSTFLVGNADGLVIGPPHTDLARQKGATVVVDYYKDGVKIIGPGTAVMREFAQKNPNTIKAYFMGHLDGLKRAIDDEEYAKKLDSKYSKITDAVLLAEDYRQGLRVWNKDMTVDPAAIRVVLENSPDVKGKGVDPKRFYDNSLIQAVNRDYASMLFPGDVK